MKLLSVLVLVLGLNLSISANPNFVDYPVFKTVTLGLFPNIQVPIYKSAGTQGPAILLVHGNSASSRSYVNQVFSTLGDTRKLFLLDLPGNGNATKVNPTTPLPKRADGSTLGFIQYQLGLASAINVVANDPDVNAKIFVGWSLGGDVLLASYSLGFLPSDTKGIFIFGTAPTGANPPTTKPPFSGVTVPGQPADLTQLASLGFSYVEDTSLPLGYNLDGVFTDPVPSYSIFPINQAPNKGEAYVRAFFKIATRLNPASVPSFFFEDALVRSDDRFRASVGAQALGTVLAPLLPPDGLQILADLQGDVSNPNDDIPIAIALGKQDAFINLNYLKDLQTAGAIPTLWTNQIIEFPQTGHAAHWENPTLFNSTLESFISDVE